MVSIEESRALQAWAHAKRAEWAGRTRIDLGDLRPVRRELERALATGPERIAVIAEPARRSPEEGRLRADLDLPAFARDCMRAGVAALALPTDPLYGGRPEDFARLPVGLEIPVLHHDLVVVPEQLHASWQLGADGVWLHAAVLEGRALAACIEVAAELRLAAVVEVDDEAQLARALEAGARVVCVSAFDDSGAQDEDAALELLRQVPRGRLRVVRGPVSGEAGLEAIRGEVDALWICGPAVMPRDTVGYLRPLVAEAEGAHPWTTPRATPPP